MLDYHGAAQPCPDDEFILSAVAKLPVEIRQQRYRKVLEPFFDVRLRECFCFCVDLGVIAGESCEVTSEVSGVVGFDLGGVL